MKLSTPFLAVESGGSDVRWEVQGETRRGFRWNVTKGASTRSLREKVDQVRRRRSLSKDKKHHHLPVTEECPPVLNRFDIEHRTKVKKRKTGDVEPPVLNEDGKLDNMIREIGSKKNRILQIKLQRGSKSSVSNASKEKSVDIWNIVKNSESEDTLCSLEPHEYVSKQCVNKDPIDKLPNAEDRKVTDSVIDKKELNSSKYAKDPTDKVTNAGGRKLPQLVTETNRSDLYEFDEDTMDKLSNDEGRQIPESVTETKESDSSERDLISIGSTDVAGNSFVPDYNHFKTHSYHKHSTIPKTMKPFINLTRIDSKTKHPNKLKVSNSSDKTTDDKQSTVRTPGADHQRQNKFDDGKFENNSMTKSKHEKETTKSKETTSNKLGRDKNESDPILEHDAIYQTQAQACDSLPNATADFCSGNTQTNVPNSSNIPLDSANGYTKETKTDNNHTKVVNDTKRLNRPVSLGDAKQTVEAKNKTTVNSVKINKTKSGKQNDESKSNTKRLEKDAETLKLPKTKNSDMSNTSRVAQENLSHSVLKSLLKGQSAIDTTKGNLLHNKNGHSGKTSENTEKTKPKANKCSFEDQLSKIDSLLLNRKIQSLDSEHLAAKKKENTSVLSPLQKQTVQVANINMKIPIIKDDNDHITPMTQDKHQQDQITSNCDTTDKVVRNSRNTISSKKSRPKGRSKSDTDKWKSFDITVIMKRRNSFQETTNDTKHINSAKTVSNDNYPSKATTAVVAKNKNPSHEINKKVVPGHLPEVKLAKDTTHKIITNKLQCDYLAALKLGPAVTNKKKTANNVHKSVKQIGVVIKKKSLDIKNTPAHHVMEVVTEKQIDSQKVSKMDTNEFYNIMVDHVTENVQKTTIQNISKKTHIVDERQTVHTVLNTGGCGSNSAVSPSSIPNLGKSVSPPAGTEAPCMLNATPNVPSACKNTSLIERNRNNHSKDTANKDKIKSGSYDKAHTVVTSTYNTQLTNNAPSFKNCSSGNQREYSGKNRQDILLNEASKTLVNSRKVFKSSSITDHGSLHNSKKIHEVQPSVSLVGNRPDMKASVLKNHKADQNIQLKQKSGSDHVKRSSNDKTQLKQQTSITGTPATKVDAETAKRLQRFLQKSINQVHQKKLLASDTQGIQGSGGKSDIRSDSNIKGVLSKTSTVPADCETIFEKTNDSVLKKLDIVKSRAQTIIPTCVSDVANVPQKNTNVASGINNTANDSIPETMNRPTLRRSDSTETVIGGINDLTVASSFRSPLDEFSDSQNSLVPEIKCENINKSPNDQPLDLTMPKVNYEIITYPLDLTKRKSDVSEKAEENSAVNERAENNSVSKSETTVSDEIDHSKNEKDSVTSCENTLSVKNENMSAVPSTKDTQSEITKTLHQLSQVLQEISKLSEEKVPTPDDETLSLKSDIQQNEKELTTKIGPTNQNPLNTVNVTEEDTSFDKTVNNNKNIPEAQLHDQLQKTIKPESSTEDVSNSQGHNMEKQNLQTQDLQAMRDLYMSADESDNDVKIFGDDSNSNSNSLNLLKIRERHNEMQKRNVETQNIESKTVRDDQLNNTALKNKMGSEGSHCTGKVEKVSEIKTALPLRQMHVKSEPETDVFMEANTSDPQVKKTDLILSDKIDDIISIASVKKEPLDVESNTMVETSSVLDKNKSDSAIDTIPNNKERNWFSTSSENVTTDMVGNEVKPDTECVISRSLHDIVNIAEKSDTDPDEFVKSQNNSKTNKPNINDKNKVKSQTPQRKESAAISPTQIKVSTLQSAETAEKYQKANVLPRHDSVLPHQKPTLSKQTVLFNDNTQNSENGKLGLHKADDNVVQKFPIGHSSFDTKGCTFNREYPLVCDVHGKADVGLLETFGIPFNMKVAAQVDTRQTHIREPKTEAKPEESTKKASEEINKSYIATESTHSIKSETPIQRQSSVSSIHKRKHVYGSQKGWLNKDGKFISGIKKPKKDKEIHYLTLTKNITLEPPKVNRERKEKELPENNCIESEKATDKEFVALCIDELLKSERRKSNTYSLPNTDEINKQTNVPKIQNLHDENHPHVISDKPISEHIISKPESKQEEEKNENKLCSPIKELCSPNKENKALRSESIEKSAISPIAANKPKDPSIKTFEELKQWKWRNRPYFRNRPFTYNKARRYQFHNSGIKRNQLFLNTYGFKIEVIGNQWTEPWT